MTNCEASIEVVSGFLHILHPIRSKGYGHRAATLIFSALACIGRHWHHSCQRLGGEPECMPVADLQHYSDIN